MIFVFYFFAAILVYLSYKSFRGGIEYLRFFRNELGKPGCNFTPFATIIAPCRGVDPGMLENLAALLEQDLPNYEVIFVVDDAGDAAVEVINAVMNRRDTEPQRNTIPKRKQEAVLNDTFSASASQRLRGKSPVTTHLVVAQKAVGSSQKVENLREAVLHADARSEVFVFVDSDTRPNADWLRNIVAPLKDDSVGAATGYRWFISERPTFGSELRSVWNASIASALGPNTGTNFCWGGSMAIRRDVFERLEMREKWQGTLSDDFALTRAIRDAGLPIVFVPQALTASVENCTFAGMLEFTTRQMKITRVYQTHLWIMSFLASALFGGVMIAALLIAIFDRANASASAAAVATIFLVSAFSTAKAWLRLQAVELVLTDYGAELRRQHWTQNTLWLLSPAIFFYNAFAAWVSRRMTWRGTTYELKSPHETVIIAGKQA